jgi:hypothetical protein
MVQALLRLGLMLTTRRVWIAALLLCGAGVARAEGSADRKFSQAAAAGEDHAILWSHASASEPAHLALIDLRSGARQDLDAALASLAWPQAFAAVEENGRIHVFAIDNLEANPGKRPRPVLARWAEGEREFRTLRRLRSQRYWPFPRLWPGPAGTVIVPSAAGRSWDLLSVDAVSGRSRRLVRRLSQAPVGVAPLPSGALAVLAQTTLTVELAHELLLVRGAPEPEMWVEPPPIPRLGWPHSVVAPREGGLLFERLYGLWESRDGKERRVLDTSGRRIRMSADADADQLPLEWPMRRIAIFTTPSGRTRVWDDGLQRLHSFERRADGGWRLRLLWARPVPWKLTRCEARSLSALLEGRPGPPLELPPPGHADDCPGDAVDQPRAAERRPAPRDLREALAGYGPGHANGSDWVDLAARSLASFRLAHESELAVLQAHREEAVPALLALKTPRAAFALALLRAAEADPWFRELVRSPDQQGWESGATLTRAEVGKRALQFLHRRPLRALMHLEHGERARLVREARKADAWMPQARWLLENLGPER